MEHYCSPPLNNRRKIVLRVNWSQCFVAISILTFVLASSARAYTVGWLRASADETTAKKQEGVVERSTLPVEVLIGLRRLDVEAALLLGIADTSPGTAPAVLTQANSMRAIALDPVTWKAEPFSVQRTLTFGSDPRTRVMLFVKNLGRQPGAPLSSIRAEAEDSEHIFYQLPVEYVRSLSIDDSIDVLILRLDDRMTDDTGDVLIRISYDNKVTNGAYIGIGHIGGKNAAQPTPIPTPDSNAEPSATLTPTPTPLPTSISTPTPTPTLQKSTSIVAVAVTASPTPSPAQSGSSTQFFVSPNGSPSGDGSINRPWDLATALNQPSSIKPGATVWLRGGLYAGKFKSGLKGTSASLITVRSYPGEWAVIDGYVTTTLNGAINSTQTTLTLSDGSRFPDGSTMIIADQSDPASEEHLYLPTRSGNSYVNVQRHWDGTTAMSHANGAKVILGGNQLTTGGTYTIYRDLEIRNSDPVRTQIPADSQNAPNLRGEGVFNTGDFNKFVNLVVHDTQDGFFNAPGAVGTEVYGCIVYNNGYIAGGRDNGHGMYVINEDRSTTTYIKENIVFNNSAIGVKGTSQNNDTVNIWTEGTVSFNNGSWLQTNVRRFAILMGANNGIADMITVKDCFMYTPSGLSGSPLSLGYGGQQNGSATVSGNWIGGGGQTLTINGWSPLKVTGNTIHARDNKGGANSELTLLTKSRAGGEYWNNNTYWNQITGSRGYFISGASSKTFSEWKASTGFDGQSNEKTGKPTTNWIFVRPNAYEAGRANIIVYNWSLGSTVQVNLSNAGLSNGQPYEIRNVQNYAGGPVMTGAYNSSSPIITLPVNQTTVASPLGRSSIASTLPEFGAFVLLPKGSGSGSPSPSPTPVPKQTPTPTPSANDIVLWAGYSTLRVGNWSVVNDATAAGGRRISNPDGGAVKIPTAASNPASYFEMTFNAQAGVDYRLWMRGKAQNDFWGNDSVFVQFSDSVNSSGAVVYRIGTTSATEYNLEDCSGCGIQGWGWQDNGWGVGVMGPLIRFQSTGSHTLRIQVREDGLSIDQIVLSPQTYLNSAPGGLRNDVTILPPK